MDEKITLAAEESADAIAPEKPKKCKLKSRFSDIKKEYGYLVAAFLLPAVIMYLIYIAMEVFPFGDNSVLVLDLNGQYVYFFEALRNIIRDGGSLLYSFSRALGGEFLGIFAYYLSSPFSFLTALFPDGAMTEALLVMFLLKCGSCGLTFGYYIHKTRPNANRIATVMFSMMYALTSYAVVQQHNTMWIDCVIYLPLVTLGIEQMIKHGKYKLFVVTLALSILSSFYIGYMVCIYVAIYFFYYMYAHSTDGIANPMKEKNHFLRSFIRIALYSAVAVGIAAVIILSSYYSLTFGKTTFSNPNYAVGQQYDFLDIITKLFPGSYDTVRPEGLPFIYCGVFALLMAPLYFLSKRFSVRERIATGVLLAVFVVSFNITVIDMFWHGMQRPNWLNCRYSFMFCFILLVVAFKAYEFIREAKPTTILLTSVIYVILLLVIQKFDYKSMPDIDAIWISIICVIAYLIASYSALKDVSVNHASMILCVLICLEMFTSGLLNLIGLDKDVHFSSRPSYVDYIAQWQPAVDKVKLYDDSFYRMEKTDHRKTNDAMTLDINGLSNSTSTLNKDTIAFLAKMGLSSKSHWSKYLGGTPVADSILGLKYILSDKKMDEPYELLFEMGTQSADEKKVYAYKNNYVMSLATAVSPAINEVDPEEYYNPMDYMNALVTAMLGENKTVELFVPLKMKSMTDYNLDITYVSGHKKYAKSGNSDGDPRIHFAFESPQKDVQVYAYFATEYPRECGMKINNLSNGTYFGNETMRIVKIGEKGEFISDDKIEITMTLKEDVLYLANDSSYYLYYLDEALFEEIMPKLSQYGYEIDDDYSESHFTGTINTTADRRTVFTTIPYDQGWNVYVDGEKVEIYETVDALIAFDILTPGEHTLEMRYLPKQFVLGLIVSVLSLIVFVLFCVLDSKKRKKAVLADGETDEKAVFFPLPVTVIETEDTCEESPVSDDTATEEITDTPQSEE
ncbi:MAG: YfhO family protein [Clostridia bacterium]|nr:YfhO family protein [Clostridia bacterium]